MMRRGGRWLAFAALAVALLAPASSFAQGICNRTQAVQDAIREYFLAVSPPGDHAQINRVRCSQVTDSLLRQVVALDLSDEGLTSLQAGDFAGMSNLAVIFLGGNRLSSLPSTLFSGLSNLVWLDLTDNNISFLPSGVFNGLTSLRLLALGENNLSLLSSGQFRNLTSLTGLLLNDNNFFSLPAGLFSGLPLQVIHLQGNDFQSLPAGIFTGMSGNGLNTRTINDVLRELGIDYQFDQDITYPGLKFDANPGNAPRQHSFTVSLELSESPRQALVRIREGVPGRTLLTLTVNGERRILNIPVGDDRATYPLPSTPRVEVVLEAGMIGDPSTVRDFTGVDFSVARQEAILGPDRKVSITASTDSVMEGGPVILTLTADLVSSEHFRVPVEVSGDGAGTYGRGTRWVTIWPGQSSATFTEYARLNDRLYQGDQTMTATVQNGDHSGVGTPSSVRITVRDDETRPSGVRLSVSPDIVNEDAGATTVTVTARVVGGDPLAGASSVSATLSKTGRSGIATNPTQRFTIPISAVSGTGRATFTVTPTVDRGVWGGDGTLTVGGTHSLLPVSAATVVVRDALEATVSVSGGTGLTSQPESRPGRVRFTADEGASVTLTAASTGLPASATFAWSQLSSDPAQLPLSRTARKRAALSLTLPDRSAAYTVRFSMTATHDPGGGAHVRTYTREVTLAVSATDAAPVIAEAVSEVEGVSEAGEIRVLPGTQVVLRGRASDPDTDQRLTVGWRGPWGVGLVPVVTGLLERVMFTAPVTSSRYMFTFSADDDGHGGDAPVTREVVVEVVSGRGVSIRPVSPRVVEDEGGVTFEVRASMASTAPLVVNVTLFEEGGMFELEGGAQTIMIAANETTKRFTVPIADDDRQQRNGALRAEVGTGTGYLAVAPARARVRILDDESLVDVNADGAVDANDALILYYAWALRSDLGAGR